MNNDTTKKSFKVKCYACGLVFEATADDILTTHGTGERFISCPRTYEHRDGYYALKQYCTAYLSYPECIHEDDE